MAAPPARAGTAWTGTVNGDLTLQAGDTLFGAVAVTGTLTVPSGVRVVVASTSLSVQAAHIVIDGTLDGSGSGSAGGSPSSPAQGSGAGSAGLVACAGGGGAGGAGVGGAGGSPAGAGGPGGPAVAGGAGSGGGAGTSCGTGQGGSGGAGGAAVHLTSSDIRISGAVRVDGGNGQGFPVTPSSGPGGGGGGGGSGGDLWLSGRTVLSGSLSAAGGNGGVGGTNGGAQGGGGGGGGGGGRIHIDSGSLIGEPGYAVMTGGGVGGVGGSGGSPATGGVVGGNGVGPTVTQGAAPVASAGGPYSATPGQTITLDATASSDPNGLPLSYAWDFSGGTGGYADATTARPSFPVDPGAAVGAVDRVCVEVSNGFQASQACSTVTVVTSASAPTAAISPASQTIENTGGPTTVTLDASHSQGNGAALTYAWTSTAGAIADTTAAVTSLTIPALHNTALSTVSATVTVSNGYSSASTDTTISIVDTTPPALALPDPISVAATSDNGAAVSWTATATDAVWTEVTPGCSTASGATFPVGTTTVTCTATDGAENSSSGSFPVTVTRTPAAVSIGQVPDKAYGDPPFTATATGTPGAGDITITTSGACAVDTAVPASAGDGTKTVTVDITAAGTCALDAAQAAGGGHTAGTAPTVTVTVAKATPQVDWPAPADIVYGTPLGAGQLDATTSWPGSWSYTADAGTAGATGLVLDAGDHTLSAVFTPADPADVNEVTNTVPLHVALAPQTVSFTNAPPSPATYGGAWTPTFTAGGATTTPVLGLAPSSPGCSLDAGAVRFSGVGTCSVTLDQAGDANHLSAPQTVEQFSVTPAATTLVSTTPASVALGGGLTPSARLTSAAAPCQQGQTVAFSLDRNPLTGVVGSYSLGSGITDATGSVSAPTVSTSGWQATAYTLTATYAGTGNCSPASDAAALTVTAPGQVAAGAGAYDAPGVGTVTFGFAVTRVPFAVVPSYVGGVSIVQDGTWSYQGVITSYVKTTASSATVSGSGTLYWWNPALNHNRGGWVVAQKAVPFTASFTPTTRNGPGTFGARLTYTPVSPQPPLLPSSAPAALIRGAIVML